MSRLTLTSDSINALDTDYDVLQKVDFKDGSYTEIYKSFRPTKIDEMVKSLANFITQYEKHQGKINDNKMFYSLLYLHIVIYFSKLIPELPTDFPTKLDLFVKLLDNQYVVELEESFDVSEIAKVYSVIEESLRIHKEATKQINAAREEVRNNLDNLEFQNSDIFENLKDTVSDERVQ
ncbi:hypothetical protein [Paenibacillus chitinolyticus]|uniref:hypothetical protein n=1 Tax=Paenibacillus chitinolyticus TaxID=79263 RepID=UPI003670AF22